MCIPYKHACTDSSRQAYATLAVTTLAKRACIAALQATIVMSDGYTYTKVLGSARQPLDIIYIPGMFSFSSSSVSCLAI